MAVQDDLECLLDDDDSNTSIFKSKRRSERHVRTPGFKESNVHNLVTYDHTNIRRKTGDGRRGWNLNEIDVTKREFVGSRQAGFCRRSKTFRWTTAMSEPVISYWSEGSLLCEIRWHRLGTTLRNLERLFRAGQHWILEKWRRINCKQYSKENTKIRETFLSTGTSSRRRCQYQEGKEARECCNNKQNKANRCFLYYKMFRLSRTLSGLGGPTNFIH